jgi:ribonuclease D
MLGLDIETTALDPREGRVRLVQISDGETADVYDAFKQDADLIRRAIEARDEMAAHNAVFEQAWLREHFGVAPRLDDTMIMSQVLYTGTRATKGRGFSHSLAAVVQRELKVEMSKEEQTSDWDALVLTTKQKEAIDFTLGGFYARRSTK